MSHTSEYVGPGIDISSWQGNNFNWQAAKDGGIRFGFCRIGGGSTYIDGTYEYNSEAMRAAQIELRGGYFFVTLNGIGSNAFISNLENGLERGPKPDLLAIDVERPNPIPDGQNRNMRRALIETLDWCVSYMGSKDKVLLYTAGWWWDPNFANLTAYSRYFDEFNLWNAYYFANTCNWPPARHPGLPMPWEVDSPGDGFKGARILQYCDNFRTPWYRGDLDANQMQNGYFESQTGAPIPPPPDPTPVPSDLEDRLVVTEEYLERIHGAFHE